MTLTINENEYELIEINHDKFVYRSKEPNPDFVSRKEAWEDTWVCLSIVINGKFYAPKL